MRSPKIVFPALITLSLGAVLIFCWIIAGRLSSPPRRALESYHKEILNNPSRHGITITRMACLSGKAPVLIVEPTQNGTPGKRGAILRTQVASASTFGETNGLLVMLHGRHGRKEDLLAAAERFCAIGFVCILPDLPAHGESPLKTIQFGAGKAEGKLPLQIAQEVATAQDFDHMPRYLWGMSMGGSFAVHALAENPDDWRAAIVVSSFDTLEGVVDDIGYQLFGTLKPIIYTMTIWRGGPDINDVRPLDLAPSITTPVLIAHGDKDSLISIQKGRRLFEAFGSHSKRWETVEDATHSNVLITPEPLYATMATWLFQHQVQ